MKVCIKPALDITDLEQMVVDCFGAGSRIGEIVELSEGTFNAAYSIQLLDKNIETVLRIAPAPEIRLLTYETNLMRTEIAVHELLRQYTDAPLPEIYGYNFRRDIIPSDYMFVSKMKGVPLRSIKDTLPEAESQALSRKLGTYAAQIHAIKGDYFGYFAKQTPHSQTTWKAAFLHMAATLLSDGIALDVALPRPYDQIFALFEKYAPVLEEITEPRLVHGDLWDANIFVTQQNQGWRLEGIIDYDRALWGDPEAEFRFLFMDSQDAFFQGYGTTLSDTQAAICRRKLYGTYFFLIINIEAKVRFEEAAHLKWAYQQLENALQELQGL